MVTPAPRAASTYGADLDLVARLRAGDEATFADLVRRWSPAMLRLARQFVSSGQSAQDAVQDAWLGVLDGLDGYQGRASLRTWVFSILVNRAKSRGVREHRTTPGLVADDRGDGRHERGGERRRRGRPSVDPGRFQGPDGRHPGGWTSTGAPQPWHQPERRAVARETLSLVERELAALPDRQRAVVTLRDVHGFTADEVCAILHLSPGNQRLLLHRGRAYLRAALEDYYRA